MGTRYYSLALSLPCQGARTRLSYRAVKNPNILRSQGLSAALGTIDSVALAQGQQRLRLPRHLTDLRNPAFMPNTGPVDRALDRYFAERALEGACTQSGDEGELPLELEAGIVQEFVLGIDFSDDVDSEEKVYALRVKQVQTCDCEGTDADFTPELLQDRLLLFFS